VSAPEALGLVFVRGLLVAEPRRGLESLVGLAVTLLLGGSTKTLEV